MKRHLLAVALSVVALSLIPPGASGQALPPAAAQARSDARPHVIIINAPTITWEFRERPPEGDGGAVAGEMVRAGLVSQADVDSCGSQNILFRDAVWTKAAVHIIREHRPNLLLFHLLSLDSTEHRYGPRTPAAMSTMAWLDSQVAEVVKAVDEAGIADTTTIFVVSDHGFKAVKRQILPNVALLEASLLEAADGKVTTSQAYVVHEGGSALVYVAVKDPSGDVLARTRAALTGIEGIDRMVEPADYAALGLPAPAVNQQMGALFLTAKPGYAFAGSAGPQILIDAPEGSLGAHGYVASDPDLRSLFIAAGRGIKAGVKIDSVDNLDIAPTAAHLLGIPLPLADGRVLTPLLR